MRSFTPFVGIALLVGVSACDSPSAPPEFDNRTGDVQLGRTITQAGDSIMIADWARVSFVREDYEDHQFILKERSPFEVTAVTVNGNPLPLLVPDSLVYGFESSDRGLRLAVGRQVIDVQGDAPFTSYREEVLVPTDARITKPRAGDTVSMSEGFWLEWDNNGSKGELVEVKVISDARPRLDLSPDGGTDDDGRMFVKGFDMGIMEPGPATVVLTRQNNHVRWVSGENQSRWRAYSTVRLPIVLVP
jgi:hypothetical protein